MKNPFDALSVEELEIFDLMLLEAMKLRRFKDDRERFIFDEFGFFLSQTITDRYLAENYDFLPLENPDPEINFDDIEFEDIG